MSKSYVVAISQREANEIARDRPDVCHATRAEANAHLKRVKAPPTDSYYANQYRVYSVRLTPLNITSVSTLPLT